MSQVLHATRHRVLSLACIALMACNAEPQAVSLAQLAGQQSDYDGRRVVTAGVLRSHASPRHYWIADAADHRVELLTGEDLSPRVGQQLSVRGRFGYAPDRGRYIEVEDLSEIEETALPE